MNNVTLVHIIPRDRLILLELDSCFLIPLFVVLNPRRCPLGPGMPARGRNYLRRGNLNVDAPTRQLHQAGHEFGLKGSAENRVSLFRDVAMQNLNALSSKFVSKIQAEIATIQSSLRLDIDSALMVTSGIFRSRDVTDLPSLAVVTRMYTAVPVYRNEEFVGEGDRMSYQEQVPRTRFTRSTKFRNQELDAPTERHLLRWWGFNRESQASTNRTTHKSQQCSSTPGQEDSWNSRRGSRP